MLKRSLILLVTIALLLATAPIANAYDTPLTGIRGGKRAAIITGLIAIPIAIGALIYVLHSKHAHTLKGCAVSSPGGVQLINEGDQQTYALTGATATIKPGDRVRISGKKIKGDPNHRQFTVNKLSKDYGACRVSPATP